MATPDATTVDEVSGARRGAAVPYRALALIGLGGLFAGVTGPLLSTFIPPLVRDAVGDPLNGRLFDLLGGYRALFLLMACYTALAFLSVLLVPRGVGEADTGPDAAGLSS